MRLSRFFPIQQSVTLCLTNFLKPLSLERKKGYQSPLEELLIAMVHKWVPSSLDTGHYCCYKSKWRQSKSSALILIYRLRDHPVKNGALHALDLPACTFYTPEQSLVEE